MLAYEAEGGVKKRVSTQPTQAQPQQHHQHSLPLRSFRKSVQLLLQQRYQADWHCVLLNTHPVGISTAGSRVGSATGAASATYSVDHPAGISTAGSRVGSATGAASATYSVDHPVGISTAGSRVGSATGAVSATYSVDHVENSGSSRSGSSHSSNSNSRSSINNSHCISAHTIAEELKLQIDNLSSNGTFMGKIRQAVATRTEIFIAGFLPSHPAHFHREDTVDREEVSDFNVDLELNIDGNEIINSNVSELERNDTLEAESKAEGRTAHSRTYKRVESLFNSIHGVDGCAFQGFHQGYPHGAKQPRSQPEQLDLDDDKGGVEGSKSEGGEIKWSEGDGGDRGGGRGVEYFSEEAATLRVFSCEHRVGAWESSTAGGCLPTSAGKCGDTSVSLDPVSTGGSDETASCCDATNHARGDGEVSEPTNTASASAPPIAELDRVAELSLKVADYLEDVLRFVVESNVDYMYTSCCSSNSSNCSHCNAVPKKRLQVTYCHTSKYYS